MNERYPVKIRRGWRRIPESDRRYKLFEEVYSYAKSIDVIPDNVDKPLLFEMKSIKCLGRCIWKKEDGHVYSCVLLNELLEPFPDDKIRTTLVHEFAHSCTAGDHHGEKWYAVANAIGKKWGYQIDRLEYDEALVDAIEKLERPYRYEVYCPKCGIAWKYKKRISLVAEPQKWKCSGCNIPLKSREIPMLEKKSESFV